MAFSPYPQFMWPQMYGGGPNGPGSAPSTGSIGGIGGIGSGNPSQGMSDVGNGISIGQVDNSFGRMMNSVPAKVGIGLLGAAPVVGQPLAIGLKALAAMTAPAVQNLNQVAPFVNMTDQQMAGLLGNAVGPGTGDISGAIGGSVGGASNSNPNAATAGQQHQAETENASVGATSSDSDPNGNGNGPGSQGSDAPSGGEGGMSKGGIIKKVKGKAPKGTGDDGYITAQRGEGVLNRGATHLIGPGLLNMLNAAGAAPNSRGLLNFGR